MAGGLTIGNIPSKRPSLASTILCAASPEETPFITRVRKGSPISQMDHKYFVEDRPGRVLTGATDGEDVTEYEAGGPRFEISVRAQEFRRTYKVGQQSQNVVTDEAVPNQIGKLRLDYGLEMLKDVETRALSNLASQADQGMKQNGSRMGSVGYGLSTSADAMADNPIPVAIRIPVDQVYTGTVAAFTESPITDMLELRRNRSGNSQELVALVGTKLQRQFDNFENYIANAPAGFTVVAQTITRDMEGRKISRAIRRGVRFYENSFGTVEVVISDFIGATSETAPVTDQKRGFFLDFDESRDRDGKDAGLMIKPYRGSEEDFRGKVHNFNGAVVLPLPNAGGGPREMVKYITMLQVGDPRAHLKINAT